MASTTSSPLPAPPIFSCQIAGRPTPAPTNLRVPAVRVRSWRRFAAALCEVSLVPARRLRAPPRRRNVLREKASPLLVEHQFEALESHHQVNKNRLLAGGAVEFGWRSSIDSQELKYGPLDDQALPDLDGKLEISGGLGDFQNGDVGSEWNLDGEKDVDGDVDEFHFCGIGTSPVFSLYEDPEGNVVRVEVNEDEIISRCATAGDLQSILSRARVMAKEFESGERQVPKNISLFQFVVVEKQKQQVVDAEVSIVQSNEPSLKAVALGGLAALGGVCIVVAVLELIWRNGKTQLSRKVFHILRPGMDADKLDKSNINFISKVHKYPGGLLGRPQLDRNELMNNIKRARESREGFSLRNVFSLNTVANDYDAHTTEIRRMVTDVHTLEEGSLGQSKTDNKSCVIFPYPVADMEGDVSATYGRQSVYLYDVSDSSGSPDMSLSNDILKESEEQSMDFKNGATVVGISVNNQNNVGETEQPEPTSNDTQTAHCKIFAQSASVIGEEACQNSVSAYILTAKSPQRIREEHVDLMIDDVQSMLEPEPFNCTGGVKQINHADEKDHKIGLVHNETGTSLEANNTGALDNASPSSLDALQEVTVQHKGAKISISENQDKITSSKTEARAYLENNKGKIKNEVVSDEVPKMKQSAQGEPGTTTVVGSSNDVQKTKRVGQKRQKKVQSDHGVAEGVAAQDVVQSSSMFDKENNSQNAKKTGRKNLKTAFRTQGAQTREVIPEAVLLASSSDAAPRAEDVKPLGGTDSSTGTLSPKDTLWQAQPNSFSGNMLRMEELKLNFQTSEIVEAAVVETKTNMHGDNAKHESSTSSNKSKMGVTAAKNKKSTKRKSLSKRSKSSMLVSNKDSEKAADD